MPGRCRAVVSLVQQSAGADHQIPRFRTEAAAVREPTVGTPAVVVRVSRLEFAAVFVVTDSDVAEMRHHATVAIWRRRHSTISASVAVLAAESAETTSARVAF
jgi:uncharacterized protein involved in exopolysaccharide biosynthesis